MGMLRSLHFLFFISVSPQEGCTLFWPHSNDLAFVKGDLWLSTCEVRGVISLFRRLLSLKPSTPPQLFQ